MRILVTGASGLLGLNFCLKMAKSHDITGIIHRNALKYVPFRCVQTDLREPNILQRLIADYQPQLVLNCSAIADVEACERHPEQAKRLNAEMPGELASICEEKKKLRWCIFQLMRFLMGGRAITARRTSRIHYRCMLRPNWLERKM